jgi:hypothetical protein
MVHKTWCQGKFSFGRGKYIYASDAVYEDRIPMFSVYFTPDCKAPPIFVKQQKNAKQHVIVFWIV